MNGPEEGKPKPAASASAKRSCWPPTYPPRLTQNEITRLQWTIDEAERILKEAATSLLPPSDVMSHDQHLWLLLFDFGSAVYLCFHEQAEAALRRGAWKLQEYTGYAGSFLGDIGEGLFLKIQELASSRANTLQWKWRMDAIARGELIFAIVNSIRVRQKHSQLAAAAEQHIFGKREDDLSERIRNETLDVVRAGLIASSDNEHARDYRGLLPKCKEAFDAIRTAKQKKPNVGRSELESVVRNVGFGRPKEIELLLRSRNPSAAAKRIVADNKNLGSYRTIGNAVTRSEKPRK